jgi:CAAX prenyl protease-like protein
MPFVLYMLGLVVEGFDDAKVYYPYVYTAKVLAVAGVIAWAWRCYPRIDGQGLFTGLMLGIVGGLVWIILCTWSVEQQVLPELADLLGWPALKEWLKPGNRAAYDPFRHLGETGGWAFTAIRLFGLVLVVPVMEEVFWRGFLNRYLIDEKWQEVPWGRFTPLSFVVVTIAFVLAHTEWTAALVWGIGINVVLMMTRNLWACVVAHAASNAVLGYYILAYEQWKLW